MLPQIPHSFDFIHFRDRSDLPHLALVVLLILGIGVGSYLALQPQIFNKKAAEGGLVELAFAPEVVQIQAGKTYEAKVAINPKGQKVTAISLSVEYDPAVVTIIEAKNEEFLPVTLKISDDFVGRLNMIFGSTIDSQPTQPGMVALIKFKANSSGPSRMTMKGNTQVSVAAQETNALSEFPVLELVSAAPGTDSGEEVRYPDNLLLEKAFHQDADPYVKQFQENLDPKPSMGPVRVEPELSGAYVKQLGRDIFIEPVVALNQVLQESATQILRPKK